VNTFSTFVNQFTLIEQVLLYLGAIALIIQLIYWVAVYLQAISKGKPITENFTEGISVVICARNEEENLKKFLPAILTQNYPNFEVIVVNDSSQDETEYELALLSQTYKNLYYTNIPYNDKFEHGKKLALTVGIKAAKNDIVLLTDADCETISPNWIQEMANRFCDKTDIVLGFSGFKTEKTFVNMLAQFENIYTAMQYLGFAKIGIPYMGVGRNMAYRKSLFFKQKGFTGYTHLVSGDDDLFINKAATTKNTKTCVTPESFNLSEAKPTFLGWYRQKVRHLSVSGYYKFWHKIILAFEPFTKFAVLACLIGLLFVPAAQLQALIALVFYYLVRSTVLFFVARHFKALIFLFLWPIFDIFIHLIYVFITLINFFKPKAIQWK